MLPPKSVSSGRSGVDSGVLAAEFKFRQTTVFSWGIGCFVGVDVVGDAWSAVCEKYSMTVAVDLRRMEEQALCGPAWARADMVPVCGEICNQV